MTYHRSEPCSTKAIVAVVQFGKAIPEDYSEAIFKTQVKILFDAGKMMTGGNVIIGS